MHFAWSMIMLFACIWASFFGLLLVLEAGLCFPLAVKSCQFYATFFIIDHSPLQHEPINFCQFGNYTSHVIRNCCKNRRIHRSYRLTFSIYHSKFQISWGASENFKILPRRWFRPRSLIFFILCEIYLLTWFL